ncbi:DNA polymerase III subunit tau [Rubripirellula lacrimiformis]|uniref:DNA polymerase III subunit tau n=1 Tax=Rubripirellula lacrimiformis TaxID=1930273 RepID=A0A517N7V3_9BACT|nr:DNA polymerase III subunit [Rubripirellula lacrimiformis]QDT03212.1 DNA polymerase III subunit tau [Rubripirellula lacrimiformis]
MTTETATKMTDWSTLIGHDQVRQWFAAAIKQNRLGGSFLFVGSPGIGKRTVANLLARTLLCQRSEAAAMNPCGVCPSCLQVEAGTHPDVVRVAKPADKSLIPVELLIGSREARMQEGFCRDLRLRPSLGSRKVAILEDADYLNEEGANCLLKTLEEPPAGAIVVLVGTSEQRQLPTIRSRCQILRMGPLSVADASLLLRKVHGVEADDQQIASAMDVAGGDIEVAIRLLSGESDQLRHAVTAQLDAEYPDPVGLARVVTAHVDAAGKDAGKRRGAMRDVFSMAVQHFRRQMRAGALQGDVSPLTLARLDRCVRALREVDRSANQATLIECFAADIASGVTGDRGEIG